jgi:membrane-associated phospholipid phosphatase
VNARVTGALVALALVSSHAFAQPSVAPDRVPAITLREAAILGIAAGGTAALIGFDQRIGSWTRESALQRNSAMRNAMTGARLFGDPGTVILGAALWAGGELAGDHATATDGVRALEAVAAGTTVTWLIKGAAGRTRPYASPGDARDFTWGRGYGSRGDFQSLPSGHVTAAFAFASAITARVARRAPARARWLGPLLYGAATLTGFSRVYDDKHWASDVVLGAGIGTVSGLLLVRHLDRADRAR